MKTTRLRNYSGLQGLLLLAFLNTALLNAQENVTMGSMAAGIGPYSTFTPKECTEAGLVAAVDTGTLNTTQTWNYTAREAGDYQLGTAWIEIVGRGQVTFNVMLNGKSVREIEAKPGKGPVRLEVRLDGVTKRSRIELKATPSEGCDYRLGFHLLLTTPSFSGFEIFKVSDFGARADGVHDDMKAIRKSVEAAKTAKGGIIVFEKGKTYRVIGREDLEYEAVLDLQDTANIKIEGNGATLVLHPPDGLANIRRSRNIQIDGLFVDYDPLPYYQGSIERIDLDEMTIDLRVPERYPAPEIGKSEYKGAFFGRSFIPDFKGARSGHGNNIYVESTSRLSGPRHIRVNITKTAKGSHTPNSQMRERLKRAKNEGATEFVVPHLTYGHLMGHTYILESARVKISNTRWYLVPYFWLLVKDNVGPISFEKTHLLMKHPETELLASWRDGFHIKNSRFGVKIDGSEIDSAAQYDDTFAIYTRVHRFLERSGNRLKLKPAFQDHKDLTTWLKGDWISFWNKDQSKLRGMGRLTSIQDGQGKNEFFIEMESVPDGMTAEDTIINEEVLNRGTVIRNCRTTQTGTENASTRFRASDIRFENNRFEDFRFNVEFNPFWGTPRSKDILVKDCYLGGGQSAMRLAWPIDVMIENSHLDSVQLYLHRNAKNVILNEVVWTNAPKTVLHAGQGSTVSILPGCKVDGRPAILEDPEIKKRIEGNGVRNADKE